MKIKVVKCLPLQKAEIAEIESSLEGLQDAVGGSIQLTYPFKDMVGVLCNEEGKFGGFAPNRALRDKDGEIYDIAFGPMYIVGLTDDSVSSLSDELLTKYLEMFKRPQVFFTDDGKIICMEIAGD